MSRAPHESDRNQEATVYLGNLEERCTDTLIWELMLQAGPVVNVHLPKDRISQTHQSFGFCEFASEEDAEYACRIMNQIKLFGKPIRVNKASSDKKQIEVGANLFIGSLDPGVEERMLYETFSAFGVISQPAKISRDPETGYSKGYGFVSYNDFESADAAIESMNGQYLMNKAVTVQYAFKKDGKGERHGTEAERMLAQQARKNNVLPTGGPGRPMGPPGMGMGGNAVPLGYPQGGYGGGGGFAPPVPPPGFQMPGMGGPPPGFVPPPPAGFNPYQQHQQQQQPYGQPPPPPPPGFQQPGFQQQGGFQQQAYGQPPPGMMAMGIPPPPPGFDFSVPPPGFHPQQAGQYGMPPPPPPGFQ